MVKDGLLGHDFAYDRFFSAPTPRRQLKQATGSGADNGRTKTPLTDPVFFLFFSLNLSRNIYARLEIVCMNSHALICREDFHHRGI